MKARLLATLLVLVFVTPLLAEDQKPGLAAGPAAELLKLAQTGVGEDVQIAWIQAQPAFGAVDVDTIVRLKDAKISEKVIAAFVRKGGKPAAEAKEAGDDGEVKFLRRYEVPRVSASVDPDKYLRSADYVQAARAESVHVVPSTVRYVYSDPYPYYRYATYAPSYGFYSSYNPYSRYYGYGYYPYSCYPRYSYSPYYRSGYYGSAYGGFRVGGGRVGIGFRW